MRHVEEHILELYALGLNEVPTPEIEQHLMECVGCRTLFNEIKQFYADASEELKTGPQKSPLDATRALKRRETEIMPLYESVSGPVRRTVGTKLQRSLRFFREHPVWGGAGMVVSMAAVIAVGFLKLSAPDVNPNYVFPNLKQGQMQVYSKSNEQLWALPAAISSESAAGVVEILDVDADGVNEIVTVLPVAGVDSDGPASLKVYSSSGVLRSRYITMGPVNFRGSRYSSKYAMFKFLAILMPHTRKVEFIATAIAGRSPSGLIRLNEHCEAIGEIWHFGNINVVLRTDLPDGRPGLVVGGSNDVRDSLLGSFPMVALLDWEAIRGKSESSLTRGFGYEESRAEIKYVQLPLSDLDRVLHLKPTVVEAREEKLGGERVWILNTRSGSYSSSPTFEYYFKDDFTILEVKTDDPTRQLHRQMKEKGLVRGDIDAAYFAGLRRQIVYDKRAP